MSQLNEIKKGPAKNKVITCRVTEKDYNYLKKNKISPTRLFNYAIEKLRREK